MFAVKVLSKPVLALLAAAALTSCAPSAHAVAQSVRWSGPLSVVPKPSALHRFSGTPFVFDRVALIDARGAAERNAAAFLQEFLTLHHARSRLDSGGATIVIHRFLHVDPVLGSEGYRLAVTGHRILISANSAAGLFYGVQTLEQLCVERRELACAPASVVDRPRLAWRGIHLDVSRHFFDAQTIRRYIDIAAHYKLNVLHWHLTDDQAWRIEIRRYPKLVSGGAFYSQAQVREIVRYAARRNVTIVPEIEMPAHSRAARRFYAFTTPLLENVLSEVLRLFPGRYIHIGGDEAVYDAQSATMMRDVVRFLQVHGRRAVAWDDALAARPPKDVLIMSWHGEKATRRALSLGYDVVVAADGPLYFDAYQGARAQEPPAAPHMSTLEQVYDYNPQPDRAGGAVFGAEATMWTEHISSPDHLFYMLLPRALALSEIVWTVPAEKNWDDFLMRLPAQLDALTQRGYSFRAPAVLFAVTAPQIVFVPVPGDPQAAHGFTNAARATVKLRWTAERIRYTTDGSLPDRDSTEYVHPFVARLPQSGSTTIRAAGFSPDGTRETSITTCVLSRVRTRPAASSYSRTWAGLVSP